MDLTSKLVGVSSRHEKERSLSGEPWTSESSLQTKNMSYTHLRSPINNQKNRKCEGKFSTHTSCGASWQWILRFQYELYMQESYRWVRSRIVIGSIRMLPIHHIPHLRSVSRTRGRSSKDLRDHIFHPQPNLVVSYQDRLLVRGFDWTTTKPTAFP